MTFPNAYAGIKKMMIAEGMMLIAGACAILYAILVLAGTISPDGESTVKVMGASVGALLFAFATLTFNIAANILMLIGLARAKKDALAFQTAFVWNILTMIFTVASTLLTGSGIFAHFLNLGSGIAFLLVTLYVIRGIIRLAEQIRAEALKKDGSFFFKLILAVQGAGVLLSFTGSMFQKGDAMGMIGMFLSVAALVLELSSYFLMLGFLMKSGNEMGKA